MSVHSIIIGGITYSNVANIEPDIEEEFYYNETALSGVNYQDLRYTKTHYSVQFFNLIDGVYESLKTFVNGNRGIPVTCGIPDGNSYVYAEYYVKIANPDEFKGKLRSGYYKTGMALRLEAVRPDE